MYTPTTYSENRKKAWMITVFIHLVLLIFFLFYGLTQPDPLPEEIGVEISMGSLGNTPTGFGQEDPGETQPVSKPVENTPEPEPTPESTPEESTPDELTQDDSEVAIPKKEEPKKEEAKKEEPKKEKPKKVEPKKEEPKKEEPKKIDPKTLYNKPTESDSKSNYPGGSKGTTAGKGNEGTPDGVPVGKGALGGGSGSWELSGRSLKSGIRIPDTKEEGTVVLNIWVDRQGNVLRTTPNLRESTTTSEYLFQMAESAAVKTKYSVNSNSAVEQRGKMTFVFILE